MTAPATTATPTPKLAAVPNVQQKLQVRRPGPTQTATRVVQAQDALLADGSHAHANAGDWLISAGKHVLAIVPASGFPGPYEVIAEGTLILTHAERDRLETTTGLGTTRTGSEFCSAVERLASLKIGDVKVDFTPGQWEELKHRSVKRGQTLVQTVQAVVDRVRDEIFHRG